MSNYYLLFLSPEVVREYISSGQTRITLHHPATHLQVDDRIIPVHTSGEKETILPVAYQITSVNRNVGTVTLQLEDIYNRAIRLAEVTHPQILQHALKKVHSNVVNEAALLAPNLVDPFMETLGGKRMEEKTLLDSIKRYITARGYYFDDETLANYHICLKTRPFVILAGLSGTGKSKLSQLYAEALGHTSRYLRLPVRPNWNDDRYLLGHLNVITGEYVTEPAVEFILEANQDQDQLYFFCLDEMNLAHVEYYFSQFLSAMEEERPEDRQILLLSKREQKLLEQQENSQHLPSRLLIPTNLFFTGTINVDETTQPISDKVIDRANTLEFFMVDLDKIPQPTTLPDPITLSSFTWKSYQVKTPDTTFREPIIEISKILNKVNLGLGYRVLRDIELYVANSKNLLDPLVAFDLQVKQRILPRVRGTEVVKTMVDELSNFLKQNKLPRSEQRLDEMKSRLKRDGYTSFWR
jgi:5-methylcytosine-specific restriction endonuclease McrBC GTP-binding regulatory subunit McrB